MEIVWYMHPSGYRQYYWMHWNMTIEKFIELFFLCITSGHYFGLTIHGLYYNRLIWNLKCFIRWFWWKSPFESISDMLCAIVDYSNLAGCYNKQRSIYLESIKIWQSIMTRQAHQQKYQIYFSTYSTADA